MTPILTTPHSDTLLLGVTNHVMMFDHMADRYDTEGKLLHQEPFDILTNLFRNVTNNLVAFIETLETGTAERESLWKLAGQMVTFLRKQTDFTPDNRKSLCKEYVAFTNRLKTSLGIAA